MSVRWFHGCCAGVALRNGRLCAALVSKFASRIAVERIVQVDLSEPDPFQTLSERLRIPAPIVAVLPPSIERYEPADALVALTSRAPARSLLQTKLTLQPSRSFSADRRMIWDESAARSLAEKLDVQGLHFLGFIPSSAAIAVFVNHLPIDHHGDYLIADHHGDVLTLAGFSRGALRYARTVRRVDADLPIEFTRTIRQMSVENPGWSIASPLLMPRTAQPEWVGNPSFVQTLPRPMTWQLPPGTGPDDMDDYWLAASAALSFIHSGASACLIPGKPPARILFASPRILWMSVLSILIVSSMALRIGFMSARNDRVIARNGTATEATIGEAKTLLPAEWIDSLDVDNWLDASTVAILNRLAGADPERRIALQRIAGALDSLSITGSAPDLTGMSGYINRVEQQFPGGRVALIRSATTDTGVEFEIRIGSTASGGTP